MAALITLGKKCRALIIWLILIIFCQILFMLLFSEIESLPRKNLSNKTRIVKLLSQPINERTQIARGTFNKIFHKKFETKSIVDTHEDQISSRNKFFISRKLEKLKNPKEIKQKSSTTIRKPIETAERKTVERKLTIFTRTSKVTNFEQETGPDDILISVKTAKQYHYTRLEEIRKTWWSLAKKWTFFFTDAADSDLDKLFDGHLVNTNCSSGHQRNSLCCKMGFELNFFLKQSSKRWFCHFDDDSYVLFPSLIKLLRQYNHSEPVYLGKPSLNQKMKTWDRHKGNQEVQFWFGTGGAGFCLSQKLMSIMKPHFSGQAFIENCERIGLPDDCTIGFISEYLLGVEMTQIDSFHSHLEWLEGIPEQKLRDQVSLSHGYVGRQYNHIKIEGKFNQEQDPSRFKSLHCHLYPQTAWCKIKGNYQDKL